MTRLYVANISADGRLTMLCLHWALSGRGLVPQYAALQVAYANFLPTGLFDRNPRPQKLLAVCPAPKNLLAITQ